MFPAERVPEKIGAYSVLKYVGRSGMADVYVARMDGPLDFSRTVSLKIVRYALEDDARLGEELAREAAICARLNHPAVMRMYDFFEHERKLVLVLEQAEGASLEKIKGALARRKQKLGDNAILYIAVELANALAHAHACVDEDGNPSPVIHRNVQPENVLVSWDGRVKLAGFGLGKILGQTPDSVAGTVTGTPGFMAPEQARGEHATMRSDVYGLGALMWSLFADAELPTDGQRPASMSTLRPDIPREIAAAIDAALEPSPDKRRITCHDLAQWASKLVNVERGRDELRQKALSLRNARDIVDAPRAAPRTATTTTKARTRRRSAVSQARSSLRRSALVSSSYPAPPSSRAARLDSRAALEGSDSDPPTAVGPLRIPPPPPLPKDRYEAERAAMRARGSEPASARGSGMPRLGSQPASRRGTEPVPGTTRAGSSAPRTEGGATIRPVSVIPPAVPRGRSARPDVLPAPPTPNALSQTIRIDGEDEPTTDAHSTASGAPIPAAPRFGAAPASPAELPALTPPQSRPREERSYRLRRDSRRSRQSFIVTMLAAALVVAVGALVLQWKTPSSNTAQAAPTPAPRPESPPPQQPQAQPPPTSQEVANHPAPTAEPAKDTKDAEPDTRKLSTDMGYITVKTPDPYDVYINGERIGPSNEPNIAPCGQRYMRLATMKNNEVAYVGRGQTVLIQCRGTTVVTGDLTAPLVRLPGSKPRFDTL
jgi:eukaryotic-like serine/threonine-protein kinase